MRLFFLFKSATWFGLIVWTNALFAGPCTVYYYTSSCVEGTPLHGMDFETSVKYRLGKSEARNKIQLEVLDQFCRGPKGSNRAPDDPPPLNSEGKTFITSEVFYNKTPPNPHLMTKYILMRSTGGKLQTILDGGWTLSYNEALDNLYAAINSKASCFSQDGLVRLNSEPGPVAPVSGGIEGSSPKTAASATVKEPSETSPAADPVNCFIKADQIKNADSRKSYINNFCLKPAGHR